MRRFGELEVDGESITVVLAHEDVRRTAKDWTHYTSATPFRVPIPEESALRPVQQYPIETDPPEHSSYRSAIAGRFSRSAAEAIREPVEAVIDAVLDAAARSGRLRVVDELAIPVVTTAIVHTLGRPDDAALLASWGLHVFRDPSTGRRRRNADLDAYLADRVDAARRDPGDGLFDDLARTTVLGRPLTRDEMLGYGYLVLAGGRDTVISAIAGSLWHLASHEAERRALAADPSLVPVAVEELLRYFSPLGYIGRTVASDHEVDGHRFEAGRRVAVGFASANHDPAVFDAPDDVRLDRRPNRHVAFGHGPHTCIGAPLARMQLVAVVSRFAPVERVSVVAPLEWSPAVSREVSTGAHVPLDLELAF